MGTKFDRAIEVILEHEGGFVDNKHDPGGATNFGISLRYLKTLPGLDGDFDGDGDVDADDITAMIVEDAVDFYYKNWWKKYGYKNITSGPVATKVLDMSVNMGGKQAHKLIQRSCRSMGKNLKDDGILGPVSFAAINSTLFASFIPALRCTQAGFYRALVIRNAALRKHNVIRADGSEYEDLSVFLNGWLRRAYS